MYPHVLIICKDCKESAFLYEEIKGKVTIGRIISILEYFKTKHSHHNLAIVNYNDGWYEDNYSILKHLEDKAFEGLIDETQLV